MIINAIIVNGKIENMKRSLLDWIRTSIKNLHESKPYEVNDIFHTNRMGERFLYY